MTHTLPTQLVNDMVENYKMNQLAAMQNASGAEDAQAIGFSLSELKAFIKHIEDACKQVNPNITDKDLGIRFYYSAYPKDGAWENSQFTEIQELHNNVATRQQAGMHTVVLIPTLKSTNANGEKVDFDFNPLNASTYNVQGGAHAQGLSVMAMNHGSLIPPFDPQVSFFLK